MGNCHYVIVDKQHNVIDQSENFPMSIKIHSCAKPFQLMPICLLGLDHQYRLSAQDITIMSSSSLAQSNQVKILERLLDKTEIQISDLRIDAMAPAGSIAYKNWVKSREKPSRLYHPCIGNHIAMYLAQRELTGDGSDYLSKDSAVQRIIFQLVSEACEDDRISIDTDTCGSPCYIMSLQALARAYVNLCFHGNSSFSCRYKRIIKYLRNSFAQSPVLLEGDGCLSTVLSSHKGLFGKTGANGVLGISVDDYNYGIAIYSPDNKWHAVADTICALLHKLGYESKALYDDLEMYSIACCGYSA